VWGETSVSATPDLKVMENSAENVYGREVVMIENQGVPSLPDVP